MLPSDESIFEAGEARKDLPCAVVPRRPEVGFDLRFHAGYDVTIPLRELEGNEDMLTVVFRVIPSAPNSHPAFFSQHFRVPAVGEDARGDALLQGGFDLGEGNYHIDWLIRDRTERLCSSSWDASAALPDRDKQMALFVPPGRVEQHKAELFSAEARDANRTTSSDINVKLLVNFAPQTQSSSSLQTGDTAALVTILKTIERDQRVGHISLVAFNMQEHRVLYREDRSEHLHYENLGKALQTMHLGTVSVGTLAEKNADTNFLGDLIGKELASPGQTDAVIFAGPKAMLNADVPQADLQRIGDIECPMFYMNYNLNPQAVPWKDSISHAIRHFKGTEFTISRPRDLWFSTSEVLSRIAKFKHVKTSSAMVAGSTR